MRRSYATPRDRAVAVTAVTLIHLALGYILATGRAPAAIHRTIEPLQLFELRPVPPPPRETPVPKPAADPRRTGAAAPANRDARATEIVAPALPPPVPPPLPAAPVAGPDAAPVAGAAPVPGPGTGGGGSGEGIGSGGRGDGRGGGEGSFARKIAGRIYDRDYPKAAARAGIGGIVWVRYTVMPNGRAADCRVTRGSGNADLDTVTCRLVIKRFRYRPGTDATGRPVASTVEEDHVWIIEPDDRADEDRREPDDR